MSTVQVDAINESTTNAGVTVDGVLIKDGEVDGRDVSAIKEGLVFISSQVVTDSDSDVSAITFDNVFSSTYDNYKIIINDMYPDTGAQKLRLSYRTGSSGSNADYTASTIDYQAMFHRTRNSDNTGDPGASGHEGFNKNYVECFGNVDTNFVGGIIHTLELYNAYTTPNANSRHMGWYHSVHVSSTEIQQRWGSWIQDDANNTNTGFKIYLASNNISTASVQVYGYRKS